MLLLQKIIRVESDLFIKYVPTCELRHTLYFLILFIL